MRVEKVKHLFNERKRLKVYLMRDQIMLKTPFANMDIRFKKEHAHEGKTLP